MESNETDKLEPKTAPFYPIARGDMQVRLTCMTVEHPLLDIADCLKFVAFVWVESAAKTPGPRVSRVP